MEKIESKTHSNGKPFSSFEKNSPPFSTLEQKDKKYLWHPFTQMQDWQKEEITVIRQGNGVYLEDLNGQQYIDGVSSLWCNIHGHRVPELDRALMEQASNISHSTFLGLSNMPAIQLAEKLINLTSENLTRVFYSDSGSEAVEIALKMAFQYWQLKGDSQKIKFIKLTESYHGDTLGSVSVGGIDLFHRIFKPLLFESFSAPTPYVYRWPTGNDPKNVLRESLMALEEVLKKHHQEIAAFVMEPVVQGAAGMICQPEGYISEVRRLTQKYNVLLIFDEVATGFGRTGKMFATEQEGVAPDLMTVAKGLTGGYLPLAATLATEEIYAAFLGEYEDFKAFYHGHTYTANPLACNVALANLELFEKNQVLANLQPKIRLIQNRLKDFDQISIVGEIRQAGMMVGIELVRDRKTKEPFSAGERIGQRVTQKAKEKGAIIRPLGPVIVLMPPLAIDLQTLENLLNITYEAIDDTARMVAGEKDHG